MDGPGARTSVGGASESASARTSANWACAGPRSLASRETGCKRLLHVGIAPSSVLILPEGLAGPYPLLAASFGRWPDGARCGDTEAGPSRSADAAALASCIRIHYLDLGGNPPGPLHHDAPRRPPIEPSIELARSLAAYGASPAFWAGLTKLYASNCHIDSLRGVSALSSVIHLYLDNNDVGSEALASGMGELQRLSRLEGVDLAQNPCMADDQAGAGVEALAEGLLPACAALVWMNGQRASKLLLDTAAAVRGLGGIVAVGARRPRQQLEDESERIRRGNALAALAASWIARETQSQSS